MSKHHGYTGTRTYSSWIGMRQRCYDPKRKEYKYYGARGIQVCPEWRNDFAQFLEDMGECPPDHSIERKDVNGNYEPKNCTWANREQQQNNRRDSVSLVYRGRRQSAYEWAKELGVNKRLIVSRKRRGWTDQEALFGRNLRLHSVSPQR